MPRFTMEDIKRAGGPVTEFHAPFKAEGTDIRNAFGVIVGAAIDEVHANQFAAAPDMLAALKALAGPMEAVRDDQASLGIRFPLSHAARAERSRILIDWIKANADTVDDALDLAFAAIAKAEGRANG